VTDVDKVARYDPGLVSTIHRFEPTESSGYNAFFKTPKGGSNSMNFNFQMPFSSRSNCVSNLTIE